MSKTSKTILAYFVVVLIVGAVAILSYDYGTMQIKPVSAGQYYEK